MLVNRVRMSAVNRAAPWIVAVAVAILPFAASAQMQPSIGDLRVGEAAAPISMNLSALPQAKASALKLMAASPRPLRPLNGLTDQQYAALKAAASTRTFDTANVQPLPPPANPAGGSTALSVLTPTAVTSFEGNFAAEACSTDTTLPSDMALAVGGGVPIGANGSPASVLQVTNGCISVFDKAGNLQPGFPKSMASLVNVFAGAFVYDPRALYDWVNHRYIISFVQYDGGVGSYWVAVSQGDYPRGGYFVYNLPSTLGPNVFLDFPRLGQDRQAIYVFSDVFASSAVAAAYLGEEWLMLPKQMMYAGANIMGQFNVNAHPMLGGTLTQSTQPANVWQPTDNPRAEFLVTSENGPFGGGQCNLGCNGLLVWSISNPLGLVATGDPGPQIFNVFITTHYAYFLAPSATQPGANAPTIDTGDTRIKGQVTYASGFLYAALTTGVGVGQAGGALYKIQPFLSDGNAACSGAFQNGAFQRDCAVIVDAPIRDESLLFYGNGISAFYPTQQPDPEGNVTTVFNISGPTIAAGTAYISRRVTQSPGSFDDGGSSLIAGAATYAPAGQTSPLPWGDYTGVAPAGIGGSTPSPVVWFSGMYVNASSNWNTRIGKTGYTANTQP